MLRRLASPALIVACLSPFAVLTAQDAKQSPKAEEIYVNIKVFKGLPADDLIPAMEFMCASMKWECKDCHDPADYTKETQAKETARQMVLLQRDINEKWFNGRLEVTCMTCHNGEEHPVNVPLPDGVKMRHDRAPGAPRPPELVAKHLAAVGAAPAMLTRTGTMTGPNPVTGEVETKPAELVQAAGGKFRLVWGNVSIVSDGVQVTYAGTLMWGEPVAIFQRMGRTWWTDADFQGLSASAVAGKDKLGDKDVIVTRSQRAATSSSEDLYFDTKTGLLARMVNVRRSSIGAVVTAIDYEDYRAVDGLQVPMKVTITFADGKQWAMSFTGAKPSSTLDESLFKID
jgi:hypothetical protein